MTKKQFGIIFTLMALIVCVGVLATLLNEKNGVLVSNPTEFQLVSENGDGEVEVSKEEAKANEKAEKEKVKAEKEAKKNEKKGDKETLASNDYFFSQKSVKDQQYAATIQELKAIIEDANISQDKKDIATIELQEKTMIKDKEGRMELNVMNKGYESVLCFIEGNKVRVVLKVGEEELTLEQTSAIQEIVEDVSGISDVIIEPKK